MEKYRGKEYLVKKLNKKRTRVLTRYKYYEMKSAPVDPGVTIPKHLKQQYKSVLGWCAKSVDSLADRLVFREFENDNFDLNEIFRLNNPDVYFDSAVLSALISSCCFTYIHPDEDGYPALQVIDGANATGIVDDRTGLLVEGYAVLDRDDHGSPIMEAYFTAEGTEYFGAGGYYEYYPHNVGIPLLVPIINRPDAVRPFGHSRISRACMRLQDQALTSPASSNSGVVPLAKECAK